ncbi:serine hydrolase [Mucilaginibacter sp. dw_454]|uniref:serine hydrolase n=1 Tax=Mucilaginibacter sp. dw_454 TaxID=2720079 RepID=UPI001BD4ECE3|nr:serine hydrolase [Mucilaginibacter sp. dw_454]
MKKIFTVCLLILAAGHAIAQDSANYKKIDQLILVYKNIGWFNGSALVTRQGQFILDKGYGYQDVDKRIENTPASVYQIASITKTFTSAVVLKLVQQHKLSLEDKLSKWYPDFPKADQIKIKNLLSHTSGIFDYTHGDEGLKLNTEQKMMAFLARHPLDFEPGTNWSYSNSGYSILGFIIARVTHTPYEQVVRKYIFKPAGMTHSGFDFEGLRLPQKAVGYSMLSDTSHEVATLADSSIVFAAGAIYSTTHDLYQWHKALQNYQVISKASTEQATTRFKKNYGFGWIIDSVYNKKMVYHSGGISGFSSVFVRIPEDDICIVLLNNKPGTELEDLARQILAIIYKQPYTIPQQKVAITLPDAILQSYTGRYQIPEIPLTLDVSVENGQIKAQSVPGPGYWLTPETNNRFFLPDSTVEVEFNVDGAGNASIAIIKGDQRKVGKRISK